MKQTAVEWFAERISHGGLVSKKQFNELLKQANEVFEQQIIDFADDYVDNCVIPNKSMAIPTKMDVPTYFNETFKQQEQ
jgi:hypothetical protein